MTTQRELRTLYICYFGLREPLVQTQVLPYLRELSRSGIEVDLLTFEPDMRASWTAEEIEASRAALERDRISWFSLPYHKRPTLPATLYDIFAGARFAYRLARERRIDVLHARSHVPVAIALLVKRWTRCRLVFDVRGLMAEEYADAGIWAEGSLKFQAVKKIESLGLRRADQIVVLTHRMRRWLAEKGLADEERVEVVPCCVDFTRFDTERTRGIDAQADRFEVVYAGSATGLYLLEEMGRFFVALRSLRPDAFFRVLTASPPSDVARVLRTLGLSEADFEVASAPPSEVPAYLSHARIGLSFRKPAFSQIAASPTKIPEYLAAGLPVVCNTGIGDMDELLEASGVGVIVKRFDHIEFLEAAEKAIALAETPGLRTRCVSIARSNFDLTRIGGDRYRCVYRRIEEEMSGVAGVVTTL